MNDFKNQRAYGVAIWDVFSETVSKCAGHAMRWLLSADESLESVDIKSSLHRVRYKKYWDCPDLRAKDFVRFGLLSSRLLSRTQIQWRSVGTREGGIHQGLLLRLAEHNAEPGYEQFTGEAINPE